MNNKTRIALAFIAVIIVIVLLYFIVHIFSEVQESGKSGSGGMQGNSAHGVTTEGYSPSGDPQARVDEFRYEKEEARKKLARSAYYPSLSKTMQQSGQVIVEFIIRESGEISSISLIKSSRYPLLDKTAISTIQSASGILNKPPKPYKMKVEFDFKPNSTKPILKVLTE